MLLLRTSVSALARASPVAPVGQSSRTMLDLVVKPRSGKVIIRQGSGGRSSNTGHTATVFGATGFLGRYVVSKLANAGTQVICPYRRADDARLLRVCGDLGQIVPMEWDMKRPDQIAECLRHSDVVYNCVGKDFETKNFSFDDVHAHGPALIAKIAQEHNVDRFIHVSHLAADHNSSSALYRSKALGEDLVREQYPEATIVRPAAIFGHEDRLTILASRFPFLFNQNHGKAKMRPVHMADVAQGLKNLMDMDKTSIGQTYNLAGPKTYTNREFLELVADALADPAHSRFSVPVPKPIMKAIAYLTNRFLWWPTMDPDTIERKYVDEPDDRKIRLANVGLTPEESWKALDIVPDTLEDEIVQYIKWMRKPNNMMAPSVSGSVYGKSANKRYKVLE